MTKQDFQRLLQVETAKFNAAVASTDGSWVVKGFIDIAKNIYTISVDTKVISKIMELLLFPRLEQFARENSLQIVLAEHQNFYPDMTFIDAAGNRFAVDLKSTYRIDEMRVNGMTLGAFTGYFRNRESTKNISFPYGSYEAHFVLGIIYSQEDASKIDERRTFKLTELENIASVIKSFDFFVQEKFKIAMDRPGSGNTRNIGSVTDIEKLKNGLGPFADLGIEVFDDFWMYYMTEDMLRANDLRRRPYTNLASYHKYKAKGRRKI